MKNILVTGAGGFIGGHLVKRLKKLPIINFNFIDEGSKIIFKA